MIHHYDDMFDGDNIKHFNIWYSSWWMYSYVDDVKIECEQNIQSELVPWIRNEFENKWLFEPNNWKPFRDADSYIYMTLGYKKLFVYKQYYFQLQIEAECADCIHCERNDNPIHFELGVYGWKDTHSNKVLPYNDVIVLPENFMSEFEWNRK